MKKDNINEIFPIVDEEGKTIGKATRGECHGGSRLLHPVIHLHVFDSRGRLYLQKRPDWKDIQPGKWDTAVGGHVDYGESIEEALRREAREELGLTGFNYEPVARYVFESDRERELVNTFRTTVNPATVNPSDELDGGQWWTIEEIDANRYLMTTNFLSELPLLFPHHLSQK